MPQLLTQTQKQRPASQAVRIIIPRTATRRPPQALETIMATLVPGAPHSVALEVASSPAGITFQARATTPLAFEHLKGQLHALYSQVRLVQLESREDPLHLRRSEVATVVELAVRGHPYLSLRTLEPRPWTTHEATLSDDPLLSILGALQDVPAGSRVIIQLALAPAPARWSRAYQRKALEHPLERERETRRRLSDGGPSMGKIILLGVVIVLLLLWRRFGQEILPYVPAWVRADALLAVHGKLPQLTLLQTGELIAPVVALLAVIVLLGRMFHHVLGSSPLYDMQAVSEKTKRVAYRASLRLIVIDQVLPMSSIWKSSQEKSLWGRLWTWIGTRLDARAERMQMVSRLVAAYRHYESPSGNVLVPRRLHLRRGHLVPRDRMRRVRRIRSFAQKAPRARRFRFAAKTLLLGIYRVLRYLLVGPARWDRGVARSRTYLSVAEVAALWHLVPEQDASEVAGLARASFRTRPLPPQIQSANTRSGDLVPYRVGECVHAGKSFSVEVVRDVLHQISLLLSSTGKGKSTLLEHLARAHLIGNPGEGLFFMEPHGDTIAALLGSMPSERSEDVTLIDLSDETMIVGLNPLDMTQGRGRDKTVDDILAVFIAFWQKQRSWGPRSENVMQFALMALAEANMSLISRLGEENGAEGQYTLLHIIPLLQKQGFRRMVLADVQDPVVLSWFHEYYELMRLGFRDEVISPVIYKISKYAATKTSRRLLGQSRATVRLSDDIRAGRVILINTASGVVGEEVSALLGATLVGLFQTALAEQIRLAPADRRRFWTVIDEFQTYMGIDYNSMLAELRKYGGSFALATQSLSYLDEIDRSLRPTVLANSDHLFCFAMEVADAKAVAPYLDGLEPADLVNLDAYTCYARWTLHGQRLPAFSLRIAPPPAHDPFLAARVRERSNDRHARAVDLVDAEVSPPSSAAQNMQNHSEDDDGAPGEIGESQEQFEPSRRRGGRGRGGKSRARADASQTGNADLTHPYVFEEGDFDASARSHPRSGAWHPEREEDDEGGE